MHIYLHEINGHCFFSVEKVSLEVRRRSFNHKVWCSNPSRDNMLCPYKKNFIGVSFSRVSWMIYITEWGVYSGAMTAKNLISEMNMFCKSNYYTI